MHCQITGLERGSHAGALVVIDVIRAFTTAAAAFDAGAEQLLCVESLDSARQLRAELGSAVLIGEERGRRPEGFDFGNSPRQFVGVDLAGRTVVQRTSNGTRGLAWITAPTVVALAAVNAAATARFLGEERSIRLVCTGDTTEDRACAEYVVSLLDGGNVSAAQLADRVRAAGDEHLQRVSRPLSDAEARAFAADVDACAQVDHYDFAMVGEQTTVSTGDAVILRRVPA